MGGKNRGKWKTFSPSSPDCYSSPNEDWHAEVTAEEAALLLQGGDEQGQLAPHPNGRSLFSSASYGEYHSPQQYYTHHKPRRHIDPGVLRRGFLLLHFQFVLRKDIPKMLQQHCGNAEMKDIPPNDSKLNSIGLPHPRPEPKSSGGCYRGMSQGERRLLEVMRSSDAMVPWEAVHAVVVRSAVDEFECPICLEPPIAPRITECGHVFCLPCVLHLLHEIREHQRPKTCPVCLASISAHALKPALLHPTLPLHVEVLHERSHQPIKKKVRFDLFRRERGSCLLRRYDDPFHELAQAARESLCPAPATPSTSPAKTGKSHLKGKGGEDQVDVNRTTAAANHSVALEGPKWELALPRCLEPWGTHCRYLYSTLEFEETQLCIDSTSISERLEELRTTTEQQEKGSGSPTPAAGASVVRLEEEFLLAALAEVTKKPTPLPQSLAKTSPIMGALTLPPPSSSTATGAAAWVELYAEGQGLPYFLHMINMKMLRYDAALRGRDTLPDSICGPLMEIQALEQTAETRKIFKAFAHVPIHTTIQLCVLDLRDEVLPQTMKHFHAQLESMAHQRAQRQRREASDKYKDPTDKRWEEYKARHQQSAAALNSPNPNSVYVPHSSVAAPSLNSFYVPSTSTSPELHPVSEDPLSLLSTAGGSVSRPFPPLLLPPAGAASEGDADHGLPPNPLETRQRATKTSNILAAWPPEEEVPNPHEAPAAAGDGAWGGNSRAKLLASFGTPCPSSDSNTWSGKVGRPTGFPLPHTSSSSSPSADWLSVEQRRVTEAQGSARGRPAAAPVGDVDVPETVESRRHKKTNEWRVAEGNTQKSRKHKKWRSSS